MPNFVTLFSRLIFHNTNHLSPVTPLQALTPPFIFCYYSNFNPVSLYTQFVASRLHSNNQCHSFLSQFNYHVMPATVRSIIVHMSVVLNIMCHDNSKLKSGLRHAVFSYQAFKLSNFPSPSMNNNIAPNTVTLTFPCLVQDVVAPFHQTFKAFINLQ